MGSALLPEQWRKPGSQNTDSWHVNVVLSKCLPQSENLFSQLGAQSILLCSCAQVRVCVCGGGGGNTKEPWTSHN